VFLEEQILMKIFAIMFDKDLVDIYGEFRSNDVLNIQSSLKKELHFID
jgi:hypothetical protein